MYVITDKNDIAICVSETLEHQSNGNPVVHNGAYALASIFIGHEYKDVNDVPEDYADGKYFFDGDIWTRTPEYIAEITDIDRIKKELSAACREAIVFGVDVTLSDGSVSHFSLDETDQINLTTAFNAVQQGAIGYPYHADGQLCRVYPAEDIIAISNAATAHKLYHTTYCNHMMAWARRAETMEELEGIVYGAELPEDLAANMAEILTNAAV